MKRRAWSRISGALVVLAVASLAACSKDSAMNENKQASESGSESVAVSGGQAITLEVRNGSGNITIRAGEADDQIGVDFTKTAYGETDAQARDELAHMTVDVRPQGNRVIVSAVQALYHDHPRTNQVDLTITVPVEISLDVTHGSGSIAISGVHVPGVFRVMLGAGNLRLSQVEALAGMALDLSAGDLSLEGQLGSEGHYRATVSAGTITVRLPKDTSAQVQARTDAGSVTVKNLDLKHKSDQSSGAGAQVTGTLGSGGPLLTLTVSAGNISLTGHGG